MTNPRVSIVMITYGHECFIEEAINGVLMQECDFEIELLQSMKCQVFLFINNNHFWILSHEFLNSDSDLLIQCVIEHKDLFLMISL
jgi:hypothetical protein